jgi:rhodanese-related sulfurtransferase
LVETKWKNRQQADAENKFQECTFKPAISAKSRMMVHRPEEESKETKLEAMAAPKERWKKEKFVRQQTVDEEGALRETWHHSATRPEKTVAAHFRPRQDHDNVEEHCTFAPVITSAPKRTAKACGDIKGVQEWLQKTKKLNGSQTLENTGSMADEGPPDEAKVFLAGLKPLFDEPEDEDTAIDFKQELDADGEGTVTMENLVDALTNREHEYDEGALEAAFEYLDPEQSGSVEISLLEHEAAQCTSGAYSGTKILIAQAQNGSQTLSAGPSRSSLGSPLRAGNSSRRSRLSAGSGVISAPVVMPMHGARGWSRKNGYGGGKTTERSVHLADPVYGDLHSMLHTLDFQDTASNRQDGSRRPSGTSGQKQARLAPGDESDDATAQHVALASENQLSAAVAAQATIVDVRDSDDRLVVAEGALHRPFADGAFEIDDDDLPEDKVAPIIVHCNDGTIAAKAKAFLENNGYINVLNGGGPQMTQSWEVYAGQSDAASPSSNDEEDEANFGSHSALPKVESIKNREGTRDSLLGIEESGTMKQEASTLDFPV